MFRKIRFYSKVYGPTAGIVLESKKLEAMQGPNFFPTISRLFPYAESMRMVSYEQSQEYETFELAFHHVFPAIERNYQ